MKHAKFFELIKVDEYSATPKYLQLTNAILKAVEQEKLKLGEPLPSINELSYELEISRDTAEKGYRRLKSMQVVGSVPGKGYYISSAGVRQKLNVVMLFNKLSAHKKIIYDSFASALGEQASIDLYIYNNDFSVFRKLLAKKKDGHSYYVIIPHFLEGGEKAHDLINALPKSRLALLGKMIPGIEGEFPAVYENFEKDIYRALEEALDLLSKYDTLKIVFPEYSYMPIEIVHGFNRFCQEYAFSAKVTHDIASEPLAAGEAYITLMEDDLVILVERILQLKLKIGEQVGIISYNETPLKKIILNGITTISTDFRQMGERMAQLILEGSREHVEIPFSLTRRSSL
ncbi:MAG TPA: GntR family transcriptional regulator [Flavitalea sp.]|nr:GntR family transcriptional regulator [Flavitalea sp.]